MSHNRSFHSAPAFGPLVFLHRPPLQHFLSHPAALATQKVVTSLDKEVMLFATYKWMCQQNKLGICVFSLGEPIWFPLVKLAASSAGCTKAAPRCLRPHFDQNRFASLGEKTRHTASLV